MDINQIIEAAKSLGIALTNAELGTELCKAWSDRVELAWSRWEAGDMQGCQRAINMANKYAI
jgi:hypothetical protein